MYIPSAFHIQDAEQLAKFMTEHSFATVITQGEDGAPFASHVPVLLERESGAQGRLVGHLAKANPQWQHFMGGREVLVIFHGPHAYISPKWYEAELAVPTWNYAVVHAYGTPQVMTDEARLADVVRQTVRFYDIASVYAALSQSPQAEDQSLAGFMKEQGVMNYP